MDIRLVWIEYKTILLFFLFIFVKCVCVACVQATQPHAATCWMCRHLPFSAIVHLRRANGGSVMRFACILISTNNVVCLYVCVRTDASVCSPLNLLHSKPFFNIRLKVCISSKSILVLISVWCCCWYILRCFNLLARHDTDSSSLSFTVDTSHSLYAMALSTWHIQYISSSLTIISFSIAILISLGTIGDVSAQIEAQPWYETLPAVAMDYKIHLDAGKEDCYYQYVQPGATLYVSFQVSRIYHCFCFGSCAFEFNSQLWRYTHTQTHTTASLRIWFSFDFLRINRLFAAVMVWPDSRYVIQMVKLWNRINGNRLPNTRNKHPPVATMPSVWTINSLVLLANWWTFTSPSSNTRNGPNMPKKSKGFNWIYRISRWAPLRHGGWSAI